MGDRDWCLTQRGLTGNVYLTTVYPRRALAMQVLSIQKPKLDVVTIPWSDSAGPSNGCAPPLFGCYSWREIVEYNCGIDDSNCRRHTTETPTRRTNISPRVANCIRKHCGDSRNWGKAHSSTEQCISSMRDEISIRPNIGNDICDMVNSRSSNSQSLLRSGVPHQISPNSRFMLPTEIAAISESDSLDGESAEEKIRMKRRIRR